MLISKFNRLIRNRLLWSIFLFFICISFVGFFTSTGGCGIDRKKVNAIAKINGRSVESPEFQRARFTTILELSMMLGRPVPINARTEKQITRQSWERLAALDAARENGLVTTDDEVIDAIRRDERFADNGAFNPARYNSFLESVRNNWNMESEGYEEMIREDLTLQKMHGVLSAAAWLSPADIERSIATYADTFALKYVVLTPERFVADVQPSATDLRTFYEANTNRFVIPELARVRYVTFPAARHPVVTNAVNDEEIENYYEANRREYTVASTNAAATNASAGATNETETIIPLDDVRDSIRLILAREATIQQALEQSRKFVDSMTPDRKGNMLTFDQAVAQAGLAVSTTALFSMTEKVPGVSAGAAFNKAAFELQRDSGEETHSDGIQGTNAAYVLDLLERVPPRLPPLDEIMAEVRPFATQRVREERLLAKAGEIHDKIQAGLKDGKSFDKIIDTWSMNVSTTAPFAAVTAPDEFSDMKALGEITLCHTGELTTPFEVTNGIAIAYVVARMPAEAAAREASQRQVVSSLVRHRVRVLYGEWQKNLLKGGRFEDLRIAPTNTATTATNAVPDDDL